ncbi:DNA methylase [Kitasatospora sp. NPDC057223]|uniref:DNA methylase n=1 Tax=Kitasatospora sp. NPDC057223 TaxID=3346055 RepID=UPI00362C39BB
MNLSDLPSNGLRILDAFCCAGGAGTGYNLAGFDVTGIDIRPRPNYPYRFVQGDAVEYIRAHGAEYDLIHTSPPCQAGCALTVGTNTAMGWGTAHVDLVAATRDAAEATGRPYVIEQPNGRAAVRKDISLCGEMFGLGVLRHRNFELGGWTMPSPAHRPHRGRVRGWRHGQYFDGPYVAAYGSGGGKASILEMQQAMGITWTDVREELTEAIPPAYTELIGRAAAHALTGAAGALAA